MNHFLILMHSEVFLKKLHTNILQNSKMLDDDTCSMELEGGGGGWIFENILYKMQI